MDDQQSHVWKVLLDEVWIRDQCLCKEFSVPWTHPKNPHKYLPDGIKPSQCNHGTVKIGIEFSPAVLCLYECEFQKSLMCGIRFEKNILDLTPVLQV